MKRRILAAVIAFIMALAAIPLTLAETTQDWTVPEGYNAHDYNAIVTFLETADADGVKNGNKLSGNYNPNDPSTWGKSWGSNHFSWVLMNGEKHIQTIAIAGDAQSYWENEENGLPGGGLVGYLDLSNFESLEYCDCDFNDIIGIDLSNCAELTHLNCNYTLIPELNLSQCPVLRELYCQRCLLTELDVSSNPKIEILACSYNKLHSLDFSANQKLLELYCTGCECSNLVIGENPSLRIFYCAFNDLDSVNVEGCPSLVTFDCSGNRITEINVQNNANLVDLVCGYNQIGGTIDLSNNPFLENLRCYNNDLWVLDCSSNPYLRELNCGSNSNLFSLDITQNHSLQLLNVGNTSLTYIDTIEQDYLPHFTVETEGGGSIGIRVDIVDGWNERVQTIVAYPYEEFDFQFKGWYDESGNLISENLAFQIPLEITEGHYYAVFSEIEYEPGDIDGDGEVTVADALLALRCSMGILELTPGQIEAGDMNESGAIEVSDAIIILRTAMSLLG